MSRKRKILLTVMLLAAAVGITTGRVLLQRAAFHEPTAFVKAVRSFDNLHARTERLAATSDALTIRTLGKVSYDGASSTVFRVLYALAFDLPGKTNK